MHNKSRISRRRVLQMAGVGAAAAAFPLARPAISQGAPLRVGLLLPYSGTFAALGTAITNAMDLYVKQQGGKLAGRTIEWIKVDDESAPPKATELTSKLVEGAFEALMAGDGATHDAKVAAALKELSTQVDVIVLAQASMARVVDALAPADKRVPIFASPGIAVDYLATVL